MKDPKQLSLDEEAESWHEWLLRLRRELLAELGLPPDEPDEASGRGDPPPADQ